MGSAATASAGIAERYGAWRNRLLLRTVPRADVEQANPGTFAREADARGSVNSIHAGITGAPLESSGARPCFTNVLHSRGNAGEASRTLRIERINRI